MHPALTVFSALAALLFAMQVGAAATATTSPATKPLKYTASIINTTSLAALLAVKQAISNDPTNFLARWSTALSPDYCDWRGVHCFNGTQDVIALLLDSNQFSGTLPPQIGQLSQLAYLNISNNSISGSIPSELRELSSLTHLDLSVNQLTGPIPSSLANCTRLQFLDFRGNALKGKFPSFLTSLHHLVYLDLSANSFLGDQLPLDIGRLSNLQFFQLYSSSISGHLPPSIANCTSLVWLHLSDNNLTGPLPSDWSSLSSILHIHLMDNFFTSNIPATLGNCTTLRNLVLSNNSLTGELPESLGKLTLLQYLVVFSNKISGPIPTSLVNCTRLLSLQLGSNDLTGTIPSGIGQLNQAAFVTFMDNPKLSGRIPETIGDCIQLQELSIAFTGVGGPLPTSLYNLSNLQVLHLTLSRFSGSLAEDVRNLTALSMLFLDSNAFVGRLPAGLGELTELGELRLQHNHFGGSIPSQALRSESLYRIDLSYNSLMGEIPAVLGQLQGLNHLYLQNNRLSGDITHVFMKSSTRLLNLDLSHNKLTGPIPQSLYVGESLDLSFNSLTGSIPTSIGHMQMVSTIKLAGNNLTGGIPDAVTGCQGLQLLDLSFNNLEGEIPNALGSLVVLQFLNLSHNRFYGTLPSSLGSLLDLLSFNVSYNALEGRIPSTGIYKNSSATAFAGNPGLCGYSLNRSCINSYSHTGSRSRTTVIVSIVCSIGGVLMILVCICFWWRPSSSSAGSSVTDRIAFVDEFEEEWFGMQKPEFMRSWTAKELRAATNGFDSASIIGSGAASFCFKGMVETEGSIKPVAIKRSQNEGEARRSFVQELKILGQVRHRNLVKGLGYCKDEGVVALVMEVMENGNLEELLQGAAKSKIRLSWEQRLSIAADVAEGLVYLHHECTQPIIHCDLKPKNILIGSDMVAKISDFGIAKLLHHNRTGDSMKLCTTTFKGTFGYAAPECVAGLPISTKADVYSYGVLLMELVTGIKPTSPRLQEQGITLHIWARSVLKSTRSSNRVDFLSIEKDSTINLSQHQELLDLGAQCTNQIAKDRPTMKDVRKALSKFTQPKPAFLNNRFNIEALID